MVERGLVTERRPKGFLHVVDTLLQAKLQGTVKDVSCEYENGLLVLRGTLFSYYQKQLAQEAVRHLDGVHEIRNEIQVLDSCYAA
jgi:osmotically-inducible protein OsmY